ncbi:MAG: membrane protease YdiL (CAAX protease family) [Myxococcota bacterium]|jgi:membrane protease YdiL (CAAX protease family)
MITQTVIALWHRALGELHESERPLKDTVLLQAVTLAACIGLYGGLKLTINNAHLMRGAFRASIHGGLPLAAVVLWWLWRQRSDGERTGALPVLCAILGTAMVAAPMVARLAGGGVIHSIKPYSSLFFLNVVAGFGLLYAGALLGRMRLDDFGLGLGDWRWWLPRSLLAAVIIFVGPFIAIQIFSDLAEFYPSSRAARHDFGALLESQLGMFIGIFGWEMLFRGVLLWVFARRGDIKGAIEANAIIFFLGHIDKPASEMFLSLPGGVIACWFGWRAGSFVPIWLLHSLQLFTINLAGFWMRM